MICRHLSYTANESQIPYKPDVCYTTITKLKHNIFKTKQAIAVMVQPI